MIKKLTIIFLLMVFFGIAINLTYDFFMIGDNISVYDNFFYRKTYANREILEGNVNDVSLEHNGMRVWVRSSSYDKETGNLKIVFEFEDVNKIKMNNLCMKARVHDDSYIFYNKVIGEELYSDEIDYFVYKYDLYHLLSTEGFNTEKESLTEKYYFTGGEKGGRIPMVLNLGKGYEIDNYLYVEFVDMLYDEYFDVGVKKIFEGLGEFRFKFEF